MILKNITNRNFMVKTIFKYLFLLSFLGCNNSKVHISKFKTTKFINNLTIEYIPDIDDEVIKPQQVDFNSKHIFQIVEQLKIEGENVKNIYPIKLNINSSELNFIAVTQEKIFVYTKQDDGKYEHDLIIVDLEKPQYIKFIDKNGDGYLELIFIEEIKDKFRTVTFIGDKNKSFKDEAKFSKWEKMKIIKEKIKISNLHNYI
jgi:hypothetical protein